LNFGSSASSSQSVRKKCPQSGRPGPVAEGGYGSQSEQDEPEQRRRDARHDLGGMQDEVKAIAFDAGKLFLSSEKSISVVNINP
jgi:hypothetical protein